MIFVAIGMLLNKDALFKNSVFAAVGLGVIGMLASLLHLGKPFSAIRALYQFGESWLSREIWFTAIFMALLVLIALLIILKSDNRRAIIGLAWGAVLVGLVDVFSMAATYSTSSVPIWQGNATFVEFYAATISIGAVLFLLLSFKEAVNMGRIAALAVAAIVIVQVAIVVPYFVAVAGNSSAALHGSLGILASMGLANSLKWIAILSGTVMVLWLVKGEQSKSFESLLAGSAFLLFAGHLVGRYLFYASLVVTGIGLS